jgi:YVTN family beta-propeller protein
MDYRILGPLEVCDRDRTVELGGEKQRAVLAMLLLHASEVVSADRLIDELWGQRPPPGAPKALQAHISRLRKAIDNHRADPREAGGLSGAPPTAVLVTRGHGYSLVVEPGELDVDRFRGLVEEGRQAMATGDAPRAAEALRAGLALWRGAPLADFAYEPFAQSAIAELDELHLDAVEERVDADLALGRHDQLVGELTALVARNPLRERLRMQLMLALYRSGRQAEALESYQQFRRSMATELGLDPGPRLQQLEVAILNRDPSLEPPITSPPRTEPVAGEPSRRSPAREGRGRKLAFGGLVLVGVAVAAALLVSSGGGGVRLLVIAADSVGAVSPARGAITAVVPVGSSPSAVAAGAGSVWVANYNDNTVSRIDPATHAVEQTIQVDSTPSGITVGAGAVWVANNFSGTLSRIDPAAEKVVQTIAVGNGPGGLAVGDGSVWVTNSSDGTLSRIDAVSGDVDETIGLGGGATDVAAGLGAVWVSDATDGRVLRVNPQTDQITGLINVGTGPSAIVVGYGSVWVANSLDGTLSRIDPQTNDVAAVIPVGDGPNAIAVGAGGVWVANEYGGSLVRIDPATDTPARTISVGNDPRGLAVAGGLVWVSAQDSGTSHRGGTLTVLQNAPFGSLDPARVGSLARFFTQVMTDDGLIAFKRVGGSDGAQVVPDLAASLPTPTDGGRTYTFQLRPGIHYSNGALVRPEDFRRAIERDLKLGDSYDYQKIVGEAACVARPARCDLSRGIVTDDAADTVTFHLLTPDPEFFQRLSLTDAVPVPAGAPDHDIGTHPLPSTGQYMVASDTPRQVTLVRNPYFHEWSHAAQPDGYPDRIIWRLGASTETAVTDVEHGSADYTIDPPPADRLNEVQTRFASQLHVEPNDVTIEMGLNTRVAPFTDVGVRRALNYAVDRAKLARLLGQDSRPTCQQLPPYIPGYQPYCPYTLNPNRAGTWSAPDLAEAQALIAASGTRGTPITIWSAPGYLTDFTATGRYLVSLLDRLGYPTHIKSFGAGSSVFSLVADSRTRAQAFLFVATPFFPAASEFIGPRFNSCESFVPNSQSNANPWEFCDPRFDATVRSALAAEAAGSPTAAALWAKADRQFTRQAPTVPLVTPSTTDLVSHRIGDYQYNPQLGILIDQLWVH